MGFLIKCPVCGGGFDDGRSYTGTSGVAFPMPHHLYEFCDAGLHLDCLASWPHRLEFSRGYFQLRRESYLYSGTLLAETPRWVLGCGPALPTSEPYFAEVDLVDWPCRLYSRWREWPTFLDSGYADGLAGPCLDAASAAIEQVRVIVPDLSTLAALRSETPKKRWA